MKENISGRRIKNSKPKFSERNFIILFLGKLLENGITKIDTKKLKYELANYYLDDEYVILFEDIALKEQIEGSFVELDDALLFAYHLGMLSNPIQGTDTRVIFKNELGKLFTYSEEYAIKMNSLVSKIENILEKNNNPIKKIEYNQKMILRRKELKEELKDIDKQIEYQKEECNHINVCLGWNGPFQYRDTSICTCLICGEYDPESKYKHIDASYYKESLYSHGELDSYREKRLIDLQNLAIDILTKKQNISVEELVEIMIEIIKNQDIQLEDEKSLVKKLEI